MASGVIKDETNNKLVGFIIRKDSTLTIKMLATQKEFEIKYERYFGETFKTLISGNLLLIAT